MSRGPMAELTGPQSSTVAIRVRPLDFGRLAYCHGSSAVVLGTAPVTGNDPRAVFWRSRVRACPQARDPRHDLDGPGGHVGTRQGGLLGQHDVEVETVIRKRTGKICLSCRDIVRYPKLMRFGM